MERQVVHLYDPCPAARLTEQIEQRRGLRRGILAG
jgi:hypothetical protein